MPTLWERQDTDTKASYAAFVDYCEMGVKRSLRGLHERYIQQASNKPPTKKWTTISTWSLTGNWQERVQAYDDDQLAQRTAAHQAAITQLIDDELFDYDDQLVKWHELFEATRSYQRHKRYEERDDAGNKTGKIIETVEMNISDWHQLSKWRDDIAKQGRRALGLPDKISRDEFSGEIEHKLTWEQLIKRDITDPDSPA